MDYRISLAALASTFMALAASPASAASDQQAVDLCRASLTADAAEGTTFKFKTISGGRKQTVTFVASTPDGRQTVDCIVRRSDVVEIAWADDQSRLAQN